MECATSAASSFQLSAAEICSRECAASTVSSLKRPVGDMNRNRSTGFVTSAASSRQLGAADEHTDIFPSECVAPKEPSVDRLNADEEITRSATDCVTSAASCFQLCAGEKNTDILTPECVAPTVPNVERLDGDEDITRSATDCVTSAASCFQLCAGEENADVLTTERVASTVPRFEPPIGDGNINGSAECIPSAASRLASFSCPHCTKCFQRRDNLNRHISTVHATNKPYECPECAKKFSTVKQYNVHIRRHENKCPYCPEVFRLRKHLVKHVVVGHKDRDPSSVVRNAKQYSGKVFLGLRDP